MPNARCAGRPGRGGAGRGRTSGSGPPAPRLHLDLSISHPARGAGSGARSPGPFPWPKESPFSGGPYSAAAEGDRRQPRGRRADGLSLGLAAAPAPGRDPLASCSAAASLNFLIFEQGARPFHVTPGPAKYAAGPAMEASPSQGRVCGLIIIFLNCVKNTHKIYQFKGCS